MSGNINEIYDQGMKEINKEIDKYIPVNTVRRSQIVPRLVTCAEMMAEDIVNSVPKFSSADFISIFKVLNILIEKVKKEHLNIEKYIPLIPECKIDKGASLDFLTVYYNLYQLNEIVSLRNEYYNALPLDNGNDMIIHIAEAFRRSALNLVGSKSEYLSYSDIAKKILDDKGDLVKLQLEMKMKELSIFYLGVSGAWNKFIAQFNYTLDDIILFNAFITFLMYSEKTWFKYKDLKKSWRLFVKSYDVNHVDDKVFRSMLELYSLSNDKILEWGIPVAFIKFGCWYIYCRYYLRIMDSSLLLVVLWQRKEKDLWNNTLGSQMASVAKYFVTRLEKYEGVLITSERVRKGIGDIDLGIYDTNTSHLLLCEVKTVFDKFRTNYQMDDFYKRKVNINKANTQLQKNCSSIESDKWSIIEIYNNKELIKPKKISMIILTWWDIFNANIGTSNEHILSCNFNTFAYLFNKVNGSVDVLVDTINELSHIYCPAKLVYHNYSEGDESMNYFSEKQTDLLPPLSQLKLSENSIVKEEVSSLASFPENWKEQVSQSGEDPESYYFY